MPEKVRKKHPKKQQKSASWMACGFDLSPASISGAAFAYDDTLKKTLGPVMISKRWDKDEDWFVRMRALARSHDFIHDLQQEMKIIIEVEDVFIVYEEPFPVGMANRMISNSMKQQAQLSGAFVAGLLRWGYFELYEMRSWDWRDLVAKELGITTGFKKWNDPKLAGEFNCAPKDVGKFRAKQWALREWPHLPEFPDIIRHNKRGNISRPENSKAKGLQSDDRYEALAMAEWMKRELERGAQ